MQDLSTLEDDFLEIEQTLSAVERTLASDTESSKNESSKIGKHKLAPRKRTNTSTFRGVNSARQRNQKSTILRRDLLSKSKKTLIKKTVTTVSTKQILPNLNVIKAKLSLKNTTTILKGREVLNQPKTSSNLKDSSVTDSNPVPDKAENNSSDSISLVVRKTSIHKNSKLISRDKDRVQLQKLKTKILLSASNNQNDDEQNNSPIKTQFSLSKQNSSAQLNRIHEKSKRLTSTSIKINSDASSANSTMAKDHLLNLVNKNQIKHQQASLSDANDEEPASLIKIASSNELAGSLGSSKNVKLKEALIQKALSEVPMSQYFDHDTNKRNLKRSYKMKSFRNLSLAGFVLLFGGYLFFLNIPSISFRVAAVQSGMSKTATLPNYKPAGYSFKSRAAYGPGYVKIEMKNNNGNKLELSQEKSSFDSEALKDNIVSRIDGGYSTYVKDGLTIYLYNKGGASWVNKGQVYSLNGDTSDLSSDEILNMAASM